MNIIRYQGHDLDIDVDIDLRDQFFLPNSTVSLQVYRELVTPPASLPVWATPFEEDKLIQLN